MSHDEITTADGPGMRTESTGAAEAMLAWPPPGLVDRDEAVRLCGVAGNRWRTWEREGRLTCGRLVQIPGTSVRQKLYPVEEVRRQVGALQNESFPPTGFVDRHGAARMFGVSAVTWKHWVVEGKVRCGRWFPIPAGGRCYLYAVEDLERLMEEMRGAGKAYWDPPTRATTGCRTDSSGSGMRGSCSAWTRARGSGGSGRGRLPVANG